MKSPEDPKQPVQPDDDAGRRNEGSQDDDWVTRAMIANLEKARVESPDTAPRS